jgi:hypothetical protein
VGDRVIVELVDPQGTIMREIADPKMTRDDVATTYAFCIRQTGTGWSRNGIDYAAINKAIMDRWSLSALKYIKEKAWRIAEGRS